MTIQAKTVAALSAALSNAKDGDTIDASGAGTMLLTAALPDVRANNLTLIGDGTILRMRLKPTVYKIEVQRIAAIDKLGYKKPYKSLDKTQAAAVDTLAKTIDFSAVQAEVDKVRNALGPLTASRMTGAGLQRSGQITIGGTSYPFAIHWGSGLSKGILNQVGSIKGRPANSGLYFRGFRFQNARMEGGSYNASGFRGQGANFFAEDCIFEDCEDGLLAGGGSSLPNKSGDWYEQHATDGRIDLFGFHVNKACRFDNCGAGGQAHGDYEGNALLDLSIGAHVIGTNGGNALKSASAGLSLFLEAIVEDKVDPEYAGVLQCIDADSGVVLVINSDLTKATAGTGNYGAVVQMRNERYPVPTWFENALIVKGCTIAHRYKNPPYFVRVLDKPAFMSGWPGVPRAVRTIIDHNVLVRNKGAKVGKLFEVAANATIGTNDLLDFGGSIPSPKLDLPRWQWTRETMQGDLVDLLHHVYPGDDWEAKFFSLNLYAPGVTLPGPTPTAPAPQPSTDPAPSSGGNDTTSSGEDTTTAGDPAEGQPTTGDDDPGQPAPSTGDPGTPAPSTGEPASSTLFDRFADDVIEAIAEIPDRVPVDPAETLHVTRAELRDILEDVFLQIGLETLADSVLGGESE